MRRADRTKRLTGLATTAFLWLQAVPGLACGYEDPQSIAAGALNLAFPDSLHLRTALWQAQVDGVLPRDKISPAITSERTVTRSAFATAFAAPKMATGANFAPDPAQLRDLMIALQVIEQARARLATASEQDQRPAIAMVYASKMLWTRFVTSADGVLAQPHAAGPEPGDVVLITEPVVIQTIVAGSLKPDEAYRRALIRFYGDAAAIAAARQWLLALAPTSEIALSKE